MAVRHHPPKASTGELVYTTGTLLYFTPLMSGFFSTPHSVVSPDLRQRTPSVAPAATAAAARRPRQRCTTPQALLLAAPHHELTCSTITARTLAGGVPTRRSVQSGVSLSPSLLPVPLAGVFFLCILGVLMQSVGAVL